MHRNTYQSDIPAGEQGPLFSSIGQIKNCKLLHISFIERDDQSFQRPEDNILKTSSTESQISLLCWLYMVETTKSLQGLAEMPTPFSVVFAISAPLIDR